MHLSFATLYQEQWVPLQILLATFSQESLQWGDNSVYNIRSNVKNWSYGTYTCVYAYKCVCLLILHLRIKFEVKHLQASQLRTYITWRYSVHPYRCTHTNTHTARCFMCAHGQINVSAVD